MLTLIQSMCYGTNLFIISTYWLNVPLMLVSNMDEIFFFKIVFGLHSEL